MPTFIPVKKFTRLPLSLLMLLSVIGLAAFQFHWLRQSYTREEKNLRFSTEGLFRETIMKLQGAKLKLNWPEEDSARNGTVRVIMSNDRRKHLEFRPGREEMISSINIIRDKLADSLKKNGPEKKAMLIAMQTARSMRVDRDSLRLEMDMEAPPGPPGGQMFNFIYGVDSLQDSIRITEIDSAFSLALQKQKLVVPFTITRSDKKSANSGWSSVTIGLLHPVTYSVQTGNVFPYLIRRIAQPILYSVLLLLITILAFWLLYRNLQKQRRLAELKNEFISNITHELKTPIATVGVAIEALKNFNALDDPARTREYLDISQNELHRLGLLVDKVLKLSMFEKQEIELQYEQFDLRDLVKEVTESLKLQLEKFRVELDIQEQGDTVLEGDRLHLLSLVFNLLDNALKYRGGQEPRITVRLRGNNTGVELIVEDNGIGIPPAYQEKVFEKFFRVPHGETHNARGYGLGLNYVAQVVRKHQGTIRLEAEEGRGTRFFITLPKTKPV